MTKDEQRIIGKNARNSFSFIDHICLSKKITVLLESLDEYNNAKCIMAYFATSNEVSLDHILRNNKLDKTICLPRTNIKTKTITPVEFTSINDMVDGPYKIKEPSFGNKIIDEKDIDIILVPMIGYDNNCNRLGYGGGYYDKFLLHSNALFIGIAFKEQEFASIITSTHDVKMDMIINQYKIHKGQRSR